MKTNQLTREETVKRRIRVSHVPLFLLCLCVIPRASIHRITGRETGLREALRWCDSFYVHQRQAQTSKTGEGGYRVDLSWNPKGNIFFGDGETAAAAPAFTRPAWCYRNVEPAPKTKDAVLKHRLFLLDSAKSAASGIKKLVRTTGFAGLTVAEILGPGHDRMGLLFLTLFHGWTYDFFGE